ncbi:hypothetical protein [Paraburkholderia humisilvae]|uniref:Uncharacterized protein n=2 Tax=Paraburkholderia humisilvae TaxID=627669 RepID=A0A6J5ESY8_9BURK|nr:hypothetical protein [Paraburkholderia humisilvae]CAB3769679.1 hypothetical protein LMG29542_06176 [Paraburkholderia humisilvae]
MMPRGVPRSVPVLQRGQYRLGLSRGGVAVLRADGVRGPRAGRGASLGAGLAGLGAGGARRIGKRAGASVALPAAEAAVEAVLREPAPAFIERTLPDILSGTAPDVLAALIGDALDEAGGGTLPIHATLGDELVRYFIVTPPANGTRMQDLHTAATVRFQMLYGEPASAWQLVADWQAAAPFLACAVPQRLHQALHLAARARRNCLVSTVPNFVGAWNRWHRRVAADAWLATLHDGALTLGIVDGRARRPRLAAVRTLTLPDDAPPLAWLHEQLARAALLDNVPAPHVLHVHGSLPNGWQAHQPGSDKRTDRRAAKRTGKRANDSLNDGVNDGAQPHGIEVRACVTRVASCTASSGATLSPAAQLAWGGLAR